MGLVVRRTREILQTQPWICLVSNHGSTVRCGRQGRTKPGSQRDWGSQEELKNYNIKILSFSDTLIH